MQKRSLRIFHRNAEIRLLSSSHSLLQIETRYFCYSGFTIYKSQLTTEFLDFRCFHSQETLLLYCSTQLSKQLIRKKVGNENKHYVCLLSFRYMAWLMERACIPTSAMHMWCKQRVPTGISHFLHTLFSHCSSGIVFIIIFALPLLHLMFPVSIK